MSNRIYGSNSKYIMNRIFRNKIYIENFSIFNIAK